MAASGTPSGVVNSGVGNTGTDDSGFYNSSDDSSGYENSASGSLQSLPNSGFMNSGSSVSGKLGGGNAGFMNSGGGLAEVGFMNTGSGVGQVGVMNTGSGIAQIGIMNTGNGVGQVSFHGIGTSTIYAGSGSSTGPSPTPPVNASVPLQTGSFPLSDSSVNISVSGGPGVQTLVDTGSTGLVLSSQDVGTQALASPTGWGIGGYGGNYPWVEFIYATVQMPVSFGNGIVTAPTNVNLIISEWDPSGPLGLPAPEPSQYLGPTLGIGANSGGTSLTSPLTALPGSLSQGVLINAPQGVLDFGPNPLPAIASVTGAGSTNLDIQINGGALQPVASIIDSGGQNGTIPAAVLGSTSGSLPAGTVISVYTADGTTLLYSFTTGLDNSPTIIPVPTTGFDAFNTGFEPFSELPIYISYSPTGVGTTTFDS